MKMIERTNDVITGSLNMEDLHTMLNFPVFMGCVDHAEDKDIRCEQTWQVNKDTGVLQLKKLVPLDILYQAQHVNAIGDMWMKHHQTFAKFLHKFSPLSVLEFGGAHGILSVEYSGLKEVSWTILEPNPAPIIGCKAIFIQGFFDKKFEYSKDFDVIVHSHVFEHIYNPNDFMRDLSSFMPEGKKMIFSLPNMQAMLEKKYTNCLNFEHTVLLSEEYIDYLLAKHGFRLLEKEYFKNDHSIFYAVVRDTHVRVRELRNNLYEENKKLYLEYIDYHKKLVNNINNIINEVNQPIYLFGAHIFSQFLLEMGLNNESIICILDNDPKKIGLRLYGTNMIVKSPEILGGVKDPIVILKAGIYNEEIKEQIIKNYNKNTVFLE